MIVKYYSERDGPLTTRQRRENRLMSLLDSQTIPPLELKQRPILITEEFKQASDSKAEEISEPEAQRKAYSELDAIDDDTQSLKVSESKEPCRLS